MPTFDKVLLSTSWHGEKRAGEKGQEVPNPSLTTAVIPLHRVEPPWPDLFKVPPPCAVTKEMNF